MSRTKRIAYMSNLFIAISVLVLLGLVISSQAMAITLFQETDPNVVRSGNWNSWSDPGNSGGSAVYSNDLQTPASCTFSFHGSSIAWIGFKQENMGISEVSIDGTPVAEVDLYNSTRLFLQVLYTKNDLAFGDHTITIKPLNKKNQDSQGLFTNVDAFVVETLYWKDYNGQAPGGYMPDIDQNQDFDNKLALTQEGGVGVSYVGNWPTKTPPGASGGQLAVSNQLQPQASCTFTFHGTSIVWVGAKAPQGGKSEVSIDGVPDPNLVDLYSTNTQLKVKLYTKTGLTHGQHTITIKPTNQQNPLSTCTGNNCYYSVVDAFAVDDIEHEYCAPAAEANSLWWLDKKYRLGIFGNPYTGKGYVGGDINLDGKSDILDLVQDLAWLMDTNGQSSHTPHTGTTVLDEQDGIDAFMAKYQQKIGLPSRLEEHTRKDSDIPPAVPWEDFFHYLELEVERSQDVKLDLGFWHILACNGGPGSGEILWQRVGGHAVTVAGVDSQNFFFAISDPDNDAAEAGALGVIRPLPNHHPLHPDNPTIHNNEANASHDIYTVGPSPSPGGRMGLLDYPGWANFPDTEWGQPTPAPWPIDFPLGACYPSAILTEVEAAVIVSPKAWPQVRCEFSPAADLPISVIRGGSINHLVTITNDTNETQNFKFATAAASPDNNRYSDAFKVFISPTTESLDAGKSLSYSLSLRIPLRTPLGTFTYRGYIGNNNVFSPECQFNFTVVQ